jgi:hypothetical protein
MPARYGKHFRTSAGGDDLAVVKRNAAGIDIRKAEHFVAVNPEDVPAGFVNPEPRLPVGVRKFGTATSDLEELAHWLKACGVTTVGRPRSPFRPQ